MVGHVSHVDGKVAIDEMQHQLRDAINAELTSILSRGRIDHIGIQKKYDISKIDLFNIISGKNSVPLARMIMFAANLGLEVLVTVSKPVPFEAD